MSFFNRRQRRHSAPAVLRQNHRSYPGTLSNQLSQRFLQMDNQHQEEQEGQYPDSSQMILAQGELHPPPNPQYNMARRQTFQSHSQDQFNMPFGIPRSSYGNISGMGYGNVGMGYGNVGMPYGNMMPFQSHYRISSQQPTRTIAAMNQMQQQQGQFFQRGSQLPYSFQQQSVTAPCTTVGCMCGGRGQAIVKTEADSGGHYHQDGNETQSSVVSPSPRAPRQEGRECLAMADQAETLAGGLEVVWREVHPDCQKLLTAQDIPKTARIRGYFTVFELLALKRTLVARHRDGMNPSDNPNPTITPVDVKNILGKPVMKEVGKRGPKRKSNGNVANQQIVRRVEKPPKKEKLPKKQKPPKTPKSGGARKKKQALKEEPPAQTEGSNSNTSGIEGQGNGSIPTIGGELTKRLDNNKDNDLPGPVSHQPGNEIGVGGAVKAAMDTLDGEEHANPEKGVPRLVIVAVPGEDGEQPAPLPPASVTDCNQVNDYMKDEEESTEKSVSGASSVSGFQQSDMFLNEMSGNDALPNPVGIYAPQPQPQPPSPYYHHPLPPESGPTGRGSSDSPHLTNRRAVTIVMKLLQIGPYQIRSFSLNNPNQLRVYFANQRMTYECQLPLLGPPNGKGCSGPRLFRQTVHVTLDFDQISHLEFKSDSLLMRVEGAPMLQFVQAPVEEESSVPDLSSQDLMLLDEIEKGALKLCPVHQLFFLNERLVRQLEKQCQEYYGFRRFFQNTSSQ